MMLRTSISIFLSSLLLSCSGHTTKLPNSSVIVNESSTIQDSVTQKAEELMVIYPRLSNSYKGIYDDEYFEAFPKSFKMLNALFGYTDGESMGTDFNPGPLYDDAHLYIGAFFNLSIEEKVLYRRIIEICIHGRWYADGVSYFNHGMKEKVKKDLEVFCELLSNYTDKEIHSFWYFYFDGPHPTDTVPRELERIKQIDERIYKLMEVGLEDVQQYWKE